MKLWVQEDRQSNSPSPRAVGLRRVEHPTSPVGAGSQGGASFPGRVVVLIRRHGGRASVPQRRAIMCALFHFSPALPCGVTGAWWCLAKAAGAVVVLPMPMAPTWPLPQQRFLPGEQVTLPVSENPSVARVGLFGRSEWEYAG